MAPALKRCLQINFKLSCAKRGIMITADRLDGVDAGMAVKAPCKVYTNGPLTLSGEQTVNSVACVTGERVLVKDQAATQDNGIYQVATGNWVRATDWDGVRDAVPGTLAVVYNIGDPTLSLWRTVCTDNPIIIGTSLVTFTAVSTAGATGATGPQGPTGSAGTLPIAAAGGTANAITANFTPDLTLTDEMVCLVVAGAANTSTTPTFSPDSLTAHTITKRGGGALVPNDIAGAGHVLMLEYNLANTRWDLLNPMAFAVIGAANIFSKAQSGLPVALTSSSNSVAVDLSLANNFSHTMTENTTVANPSNATAGQSGQIAFTQHASAAKTLALGTHWLEINGLVPSISTTTGAQNLLSYYVADSTHIWFSYNKNGIG